MHSCDRFLHLLSLVILVILSASSSADGVKKGNNNNNNRFSVGMQPDPFVMAAPFVIAATCQEGIVMMASHPNTQAEEPLLLLSLQQEDLGSELSPRIPAVDGHGTSMASCGWRADSQALTARVQQLAATHRREFGIPTHSRIYDRRLATETALYLAKQAVSEGTRPFSCASLLAVPGRETGQAGTLWLVDATGAYRIRALCLGGGRRIIVTNENNKDEPPPNDFCHVMNQRLSTIDFSEMTLEECQKKIVQLLQGTSDGDRKEELSTLLKEETVVEIALIGKSARRVKAEKLNPAVQL